MEQRTLDNHNTEYRNLRVILSRGKETVKDKSRKGGKVKWRKLFISWLHQGFTYLDHTEMICRAIWELLWFAAFLSLFLFIDLPIWLSFILAFLITHTLNFMFNYNFWTCVTFYLPETNNPGNEKTREYLNRMQIRMKNDKPIAGVMVFGSLSRAMWHNKSDLDIRVLRNPGLINGLLSYLIVHRERLIAFFNKQPLDMYLVDGPEHLSLMRGDEYPIFIKVPETQLRELYGNNMTEANLSCIKDLNQLAKR